MSSGASNGLDGEINAVVTRDFEAALERAATADDVQASGERLGPLHGVPFTAKDALMTAGIRSTGGARELTDNVPDTDAAVVAAARAAGAIVIGKTNLPRWSADNPVLQRPLRHHQQSLGSVEGSRRLVGRCRSRHGDGLHRFRDRHRYRGARSVFRPRTTASGATSRASD